MNGQYHLNLTKDDLKRFHSLTSDCFMMFKDAVENGFDNHGKIMDSIIAKYGTDNRAPERCILVGYGQALLALSKEAKHD